MAAFPHAYALILFEGYGEQRESAISRTQMTSGPPKQLKTKSRVLVTRPIKILLRSNADYDAFIAWFANDVNEGADWFDFTDPRDSVEKPGRLTGQALDAKPTRKNLSRWIIPFNLETWSA